MKIQFIINSRSRRQPATTAVNRIRDKFTGHECRIARTAHPGHARQLAEQAVESGCDAVVAVGGDGTVHEIVNGCRGSDTPTGIIPAGAANDLATRLGIPSAFDEACDVILSGQVRRIDAMHVNGRYILTTCGTGFPAAVIAAVHGIFEHTVPMRSLANCLRHRVYAVGVAIACLRQQPYATIRICCDGRWRETSSMSLIIGLQPNLGSYFTPLPHLDATGTLMAAYSVDAGGRLRMVRHVLRTTRGAQQDLPGTRFLHGRRIVLESPTAMPFFGDGELFQSGNRFEIDRISGAAPVIVPANGRERS